MQKHHQKQEKVKPKKKIHPFVRLSLPIPIATGTNFPLLVRVALPSGTVLFEDFHGIAVFAPIMEKNG